MDLLSASRDAPAVLQAVMTALQDAGLVCVLPGRKTQVWALEPERLYVSSETAVMSCPSSQRTLVVPAPRSGLVGKAPPASIWPPRKTTPNPCPPAPLGQAGYTAMPTSGASCPPSTPRWCPGRSATDCRSALPPMNATLGIRICFPPRRPWSWAWTSAAYPASSSVPSLPRP